MRILIYGINFSPELTGIGKYTGELVDWLVDQGHECNVVTAPPYYPEWKVAKSYSDRKYQTERFSALTIHRCPLWVPKNINGKSRILHLLSFVATSTFKLFSQFTWKPDVVITVAPAFMCAPGGLLAAKLFGAKSVLHIQDFEIDAMFGLGMLGKGRLLPCMAYGLEKLLMRAFDQVTTISFSMCMKLNEKGVCESKVGFFPNWVDTSLITPAGDRNRYRQLWGFKNDDIVVLYSGNLGKKQGLDLVLDAAKKIGVNNKLQFVFVGDGVDKQNLFNLATKMQLTNVSFHPLQPLDALPDLLRFADIHLVVQRKGAADAVLPSKVTGILAAGGQAIITAELKTELGQVMRANPDIATVIPPEDVDALVAAIKRLTADIDPTNRQHNVYARDFAKRNLGKEKILKDFENTLFQLTCLPKEIPALNRVIDVDAHDDPLSSSVVDVRPK